MVVVIVPSSSSFLLLISGDCWKSDDGDIQIREGSIVRLRILGLTIEATSIVSRSRTCYVFCKVERANHLNVIISFAVCDRDDQGRLSWTSAGELVRREETHDMVPNSDYDPSTADYE